MSFFSAENISAGYNGKTVLNNISFQVEKNSIIGILGANGSGKTTLLKAICNIINHSGICMLDNQNLSKLSARELSQVCSYIPQRSGIDIDISLIDVVCMGFNSRIGIFNQPTKEMRHLAIQALDKVGLRHKAYENYRSLSEGQKQLCIAARTIVSNPKLMVLDEPESALDINHRYKIMSIFKNMAKESDSCAIITLHDPNLALQMCDRLVLLKNGEILNIIEPKNDGLEYMENALSKLYGTVSLVSCKDKFNKSHLVILNQSEDFLCSL